MAGARFPRSGASGGGRTARGPRHYMILGICASVLILGALVWALGSSDGSVAGPLATDAPVAESPAPASPTVTPTVPSTPQPPATPYPSNQPGRPPTPSDSEGPVEEAPEVGPWPEADPSTYEPGPTEFPTPEPTTGTPTPSPSVNHFWLARAQELARKYWLGDTFVRQVMQESGFSDDVITGQRVSSAGAEGIAQIMRAYHPKVDPLNPDAALNYAAQHMIDLLLRYDGNVPKALAAYNAGAGTVDEAIATEGDSWLGWMPAESQAYVELIMLPSDPDKLPRWDDLKQWWTLATEGLGQRMHLRLLLGSMVAVGALPAPSAPR